MIKNFFKGIWSRISRVIAWLEKQIIDHAEHLSRDGRSLRVILNWVYCIFYLWLVWYGVTHYKECLNTAIVSTSTLVAAIFTGYVFSKSYEKGKLAETLKSNQPVQPPTPEEDGASD